jgi:hypothetical protein
MWRALPGFTGGLMRSTDLQAIIPLKGRMTSNLAWPQLLLDEPPHASRRVSAAGEAVRVHSACVPTHR